MLGHEGVGVIEAVGSAVRNLKPGDSAVIVGAGPVGMAALLTAQFYSPAMLLVVDGDTNRLEVAQRFDAPM